MADVFISYAREDRALAEALARDLEEKGISVWWDAELVGSDDYQEVILTALSKAKAAIVLWTRFSVKSLFVRDEARYALHHKKLIAVKEARLDVLDLPFGFQSQHTDDIADRYRILRALSKLGIDPPAQPAHAASAEAGWEQVKATGRVDDVLAWLEKHPADPNRQEAFRLVRSLVSAEAGAGVKKDAAQTTPAGLVRTSNLSAFLAGLTFRIPSFQLSTQGAWSSAGFAVGFLILLAVGLLLWLMIIGIMVEHGLSDATILPVAIMLLSLIAYATWLRFSSWATQRNFIAAYIVVPFFLVLTLLLGMFVVKLLVDMGTDQVLAAPLFFATQAAAIAAVVWKIRTVR